MHASRQSCTHIYLCLSVCVCARVCVCVCVCVLTKIADMKKRKYKLLQQYFISYTLIVSLKLEN